MAIGYAVYAKESTLADPDWYISTIDVIHLIKLSTQLTSCGGVMPGYIKNLYTTTKVSILYIQVAWCPKSIK